jgi:hypothetical protein
MGAGAGAGVGGGASIGTGCGIDRGRVKRVSTDHSVDFVLREGRVAALNFRRMQPGCVGGDARLLPH